MFSVYSNIIHLAGSYVEMEVDGATKKTPNRVPPAPMCTWSTVDAAFNLCVCPAIFLPFTPPSITKTTSVVSGRVKHIKKGIFSNTDNVVGTFTFPVTDVPAAATSGTQMVWL